LTLRTCLFRCVCLSQLADYLQQQQQQQQQQALLAQSIPRPPVATIYLLLLLLSTRKQKQAHGHTLVNDKTDQRSPLFLFFVVALFVSSILVEKEKVLFLF
jgi:hypothetical protein